MTFYDATGAGFVPPRLSDRDRAAARVRAQAWPRRTFAVAIACVAATAVIAYALWPLTGTIVPWDSKNQFYPFFRFLGEALRHGSVPLWNPYQYGGSPSAADPQSLLFTPTLFLLALIAPEASMRVFDAAIYAHLAMGAVGVLGLARRWRWHPPAAVLAALVFMLGGATSSRLEHTGMIVSYSFFPLALWCLQAALDRRSLRLAVGAGLLATLMAIGRDQVAFLLCLALAGSVARAALRSDDWHAYLRGRAPVILTAGLTAVALMIVPILLTLQFVRDSNRPAIAYGVALAGSLDPINLLTLLAPNMFGSLDHVRDYWGPGAATLAGNDWTDPTIDYLFAGTLPVLLLVWHGLAGGRLLERGARYFTLVLVAAGLYAIGRHTAIFGLVFDWVPGVALYRRPADASFVVNVAIAFLSGYLLHRFVEEGSPRLALVASPAGFLSILTTVGTAWLVGAGLAFARHAGHLDRSAASLAVALAFCATACVVLIAMSAPQRRSLAAAMLVAATAGQLVWRNAASALNAEPIERYAADSVLPADQMRGLEVLRRDMQANQRGGVAPRVEVQGIDGPWQNAAMIFALQNVAGYNPLRIAAYERAVGVGESTNDPSLRSFPDTFRGYNSRLAAMLGLRYLILGSPLDALPRNYPRPRAALLYGSQGFYIYRLNQTTVPRAHVATHLVAVDTDDILDEGDIPIFDLTREALVDKADLSALRGEALLNPAPTPAAEPANATIADYGHDHVRVTVDTPQAGLLVLHDIAYPGWVASVDGRETPILRTDLLFRGVEVGAGHHTVEFAFHPLSLANLRSAAASVLRRDTAHETEE